MPSYVVITDNTGAALGEGPIYRATRWVAASRLDRTARCSFEVPAADPRAHDLLQNKRQAHYYAVMGDGPQEVGALIIDQIETVVEGRAEPMLRVSGDNLLADLATRSVHGLELYDVEGHTAHSVAHTYLDGGEYVTTDMDTAYDGDGGTTYSLDTGLDVDNYLYVCGQSKVSAIWIVFGGGTNSNTADIIPQYWNGTEWTTCANIADATSVTGRTFAQNGKISFDRPRDQVSTTHNGVEGYWIRLTPSADLSDGIVIGDVSVAEDTPTPGGLADIMAYAPPGWTIATSNGGYAATKNTAYMQFAGETVLEALTMLAEHTGEHFRLGVGKSIDWLQDDPREAPVDSGVYAVQFPTASTEACAILELAEARDSYDLASRVYPYGARQGSARVTLADCTETPPAGFTLSNETIDGATYHYLKADNAENTIGRIDAVREWSEVGLQDDDAHHAVLAANALYQVALEWLQRYSQVHYAYTLRVAHLEREVWPGESVRVTYQRHRDGERYIDIDGAMVVLGVEMVEDGAGIRTTALEIASTDAWPLSGAEFMVREIRSARRARAGHASSTTLTDTIVSSNVNIDGGTIDGTPIGSNDPASGVFTTLHATENITTDGTVDGVDVAAHASNDSAHHNPVTVGNTGLSLSTQQLSLNLAATSGLQIDAGLKIADTIAGNGLTISGKVLAVGEGAGLTVSADAIALTKPGTLAHNSLNAAAGNHTHAITSSSNPGAAASILASSASGYLQLRRIGLGTAPSYPLHVSAATQQARFDYNTSNYLSITVGSDGSTLLSTATSASGGNLTLLPAGDIILDPTGLGVMPNAGYEINLGSLQKKYLTLHCAELWVETLVAQNTIATIGGRILVGPTTELTSDLTDSGSTFWVRHNEMAYGDRVYLEANGKVEFMAISQWAIIAASVASHYFRVSGDVTAFFPADTYFTVAGSTGNDDEYQVTSSSYDDINGHTNIIVAAVPDGTADGGIVYTGEQGVGPFRYRILRNLDTSGANAWYAGDAVFNTGTVGDGFIDLYSVASVKGGLQNGPTIVGNVRNSATYNNWSEHWAIGNLSGLYGYGSTAYGFAAGKYANNQSFVTVDATNGVRMLHKNAGGTDTTLAQWAVDGVLTIGEVANERNNVRIASGALSIRNNTTERIGLTAAGVLSIKDSAGAPVITLDASKGAEITKKLTMPGAGSAIAIGATPPTSASAGTGLWLDRTGLYGLASDAVQAKFDAATGAITAGGGSVMLNSAGIKMLSRQVTSYGSAENIKFYKTSSPTTLLAAIGCLTGLADSDSYLSLVAQNGTTNVISLIADSVAMNGGLNVGSATGAPAGAIIASGSLTAAAIRTGGKALDDDTAYAITAPQNRALIAIWDASVGLHSALCVYRVDSTAHLTALGNTGNMNRTTGALAGTTGTDGYWTISAHTDGKIYVENRMGGTRTVRWAFLA